MFKSPTNFEDETTTADKKNMTHENFSRNYGHNFQNAKNEENPSSTCLNKPIFRLIPKKLFHVQILEKRRYIFVAQCDQIRYFVDSAV